MAISELQHRLEHLVSYSSQLIFISGDSIAQQQKSLQTFLGHQSENSEIAFVNGESGITKQSYRKLIKEQLLGEGPDSFDRPLGDLLASLNDHENPVLICICQADKIPNDFLQELWGLLLQSRTASNKLHLNILLFAQSDWAEKAKAWLPSKNGDKPLLISTESVIADSLQSNNVDSLIAQKRREFEQHKIARATQQPPPKTLLTAMWFRVLIGLAFLAVFSGLMLWLYPVELSPPVKTEESALTLEDVTSNSNSVAVPENKSTETDSAQNRKPQPTESSVDIQPGGNDELVLKWQETLAESNSSATDLSSSKAISEPNDQAVNTVTNPTEVSSIQAATEYLKVEDGKTVEQADEQDVRVEPRFDSDAQDILQMQASQYVLQILGLSNQANMQQFVNQNDLHDKVWIYQTNRLGAKWYVLLYRKAYANSQEARQDIVNLPAAMQSLTPFAKPVRQAQQEISVQ